MPQERQVEGGISVMCYRMMPVSIQAIGSTYDDVPVTGTFFIRHILLVYQLHHLPCKGHMTIR